MATCSALEERLSVRAAQMCRESVSPGRNGLSGQVGEARFQLLQLMSVLVLAVYKSAADSPNARPAARISPVIIRGRHAGSITRKMVCQCVAPRPRLPRL